MSEIFDNTRYTEPSYAIFTVLCFGPGQVISHSDWMDKWRITEIKWLKPGGPNISKAFLIIQNSMREEVCDNSRYTESNFANTVEPRCVMDFTGRSKMSKIEKVHYTEKWYIPSQTIKKGHGYRHNDWSNENRDLGGSPLYRESIIARFYWNKKKHTETS